MYWKIKTVAPESLQEDNKLKKYAKLTYSTITTFKVVSSRKLKWIDSYVDNNHCLCGV